MRHALLLMLTLSLAWGQNSAGTARRVLTAGELLEVIRTAVDRPDADLEMADFYRGPVPEGALVSEGLTIPNNPGSAPLLWRGRIETSEHRRAPVWAHVFVRVRQSVLVAVRDVNLGEALSPRVLEMRLQALPFGTRNTIADPAQAVGQTALRRIRAGEVVRREWLAAPAVVQRGQAVDVEVRSGRSSLRFRAEAVSNAQLGEMVALRNPVSGKRFRAVATAPGQAEMDVGREGQ
jgi:flagella basal body P-ring formation protein FlgA